MSCFYKASCVLVGCVAIKKKIQKLPFLKTCEWKKSFQRKVCVKRKAKMMKMFNCVSAIEFYILKCSGKNCYYQWRVEQLQNKISLKKNLSPCAYFCIKKKKKKEDKYNLCYNVLHNIVCMYWNAWILYRLANTHINNNRWVMHMHHTYIYMQQKKKNKITFLLPM